MCGAREEMRSVYKPVRGRIKEKGGERRGLKTGVYSEGGTKTTLEMWKKRKVIEKSVSLLFRQVNLSPTQSLHKPTQKTFY